MIRKELELLRPTTSSEAVALLEGRGDDITVLAGGMSLMPMMNLGIVRPELVMSLNHITDLGDVTYNGELRIGAMVRHQEVQSHELITVHAPMLAAAAGSIGDVQIRNRGTIGGSICHADPSGDYSPVTLVSGASVELTSTSGVRLVPVDEFLIDMMYTSRDPEELATAIVVPAQPPGAGSAYVRFARVEGSFAIVNAAALIAPGFESTRVAIGGVGSTPVEVDVSDAFADGPAPSAFDELAARAYDAAATASSDVHSDAEYRRHMAAVFAKRAVQKAIAGM